MGSAYPESEITMPDALLAFSVTDWLDKGAAAPILRFQPCDHPGAAETPLVATIDDDTVASVHLTPDQIAFLAVELTRAVGLHPPVELENLARSSARNAPAEVTTMLVPAPDPRDALLRQAFAVLANGYVPVPEQRAVALRIAAVLFGTAGR